MFGLSWGVIKLIAYGLLAATILGFATYVKVEWDAGQKAQATLHVAEAQTKAVAVAVQKTDQAAGKAETVAQKTIAASTQTIIKKVPVYVHVSTPGAPVPCIPWGVVRLHDAAVLGVDPASLPNPAGQSDDACSTVTAADLASRIVTNYGIARANAEQLNALEADEKARAASATAAATQAQP